MHISPFRPCKLLPSSLLFKGNNMGGNLKKKSVKILGRSPLKSILPIFGTIDKSIYLSPILLSEARRRVSKRRRGKRFFSRRFHGKTVFWAISDAPCKMMFSSFTVEVLSIEGITKCVQLVHTGILHALFHGCCKSISFLAFQPRFLVPPPLPIPQPVIN